jgi:GT2 family glycosyltransferase
VKIGVLVLNWNRPTDTLACLESVFRLEYRERITYVIDNGSQIDCRKEVTTWLARRAAAHGRRYREISVKATPTYETSALASADTVADEFVYLQLPRNVGYAGGNNVGIRIALAEGCDAVWILNNDTTVAPDALGMLVSFAANHMPFAAAGVCILEHDRPGRVQCLGGGNYNWALSRHTLVGSDLDISEIRTWPPPTPDYVAGSAMFIPRSTLETVGLLDERFFLYCEEVDFAERCRQKGLRPVVCVDARVRHIFGASTGTTRDVATKSSISGFYGSRSAVLLTAKHKPVLLPIVVTVRLAYAALVLLRGRRGLARAVLAGVVSGLLKQNVSPPG